MRNLSILLITGFILYIGYNIYQTLLSFINISFNTYTNLL